MFRTVVTPADILCMFMYVHVHIATPKKKIQKKKKTSERSGEINI